MEEAWRKAKGEPSITGAPTRGQKAVATPYAGREHWHDMLDRILTRGTDRQQLGIQSNLEAFDANLPALRRGKAG